MRDLKREKFTLVDVKLNEEYQVTRPVTRFR